MPSEAAPCCRAPVPISILNACIPLQLPCPLHKGDPGGLIRRGGKRHAPLFVSLSQPISRPQMG